MTDVIPEREGTAQRLLEASVRRSYDPAIEIDWEAPAEPGLFWLPPHRSSLYGTPLWSQLDHDTRVELTKHEVASAGSAGIWFETLLMQMLIRVYYDMDPTTRHAQYALTEVADECRHSIMFGRMLEAMGVAPLPASRVDHALGRFLKSTATGPHLYATILLAEETLDAFQREIMVDETLQPLIRTVCRIHVVEEARHVRYAREELARQVGLRGPASLSYSRVVIGRTAVAITRRLLRPQIYEAVGIPGRLGVATALANPHFRDTLRWSASKAVAYFTELGLIEGALTRALWRRSALL